MEIPKQSTTFFVAVALTDELFGDEGFSCGMCVEVTCRDTKCLPGSETIEALVIDSCPGCYGPYDTDYSTDAWNKLTGNLLPDHIYAEWKYVKCSDNMIQGNI